MHHVIPTTPQPPADTQSVEAGPTEPTTAPATQPAAPVTQAATPVSEAAAVREAAGPVSEVATPTAEVAAADRTEAWAKIVADPAHSPELLALAAIQTIGPRAKEWASRISDAYPTATADGKARLAVRQFTRFGSLSTVCAALAGSYAPVALLGTTALTHADLVLHIAAAYGFDPADESRAAELLVLTKVHPTRQDAEAALNAAKQPAYEDEDGGLTDALWRLGRMLATQVSGWTAIRTVNRLFPGSSLLAAVLTSRSSAQSLAARAERFYSQERAAQAERSHS